MALISSTPYQPHAFSEIEHGTFPMSLGEVMYDQWCRKFERMDHISAQRINYDSDGVAVQGFVVMPKDVPAKGLPLLVFNRGGMQRFGMNTVLQMISLLVPLAEKGYLVVASQYRGNDGSEGEEEFGGADVGDVLNLLALGKEMPEWNGKQSYMLGWSRGGMMTYLALKAGADVNAAGSIAGVADLPALAVQRPEMETQAYRVLIPHASEEEYQSELNARSAVLFADEINVPLHLQHGDADDRVPGDHSVRLAEALAKAGKTHELVIHEGGDHFMNRIRETLLENAHQWFEGHK